MATNAFRLRASLKLRSPPAVSVRRVENDAVVLADNAIQCVGLDSIHKPTVLCTYTSSNEEPFTDFDITRTDTSPEVIAAAVSMDRSVHLVKLARPVPQLLARVDLGGEPLACRCSGNYVFCAVEDRVVSIDLLALDRFMNKKKKSAGDVVGLSPAFAACHQLHAIEVTSLCPVSRPNQQTPLLISGDEDGFIVVADVGQMSLRASESDDLMLGGHKLSDGISDMIQVQDDALMVRTLTEKFCVLRLPCLTAAAANENFSECVLEILPLSDSIRVHPHLLSNLNSETPTHGKLVSSVFDPISQRAFMLATSCEGQMGLYHVGADKSVELAATFESHPSAHVDLVRASCFVNETLLTVGDDAQLCLWSQEIGLEQRRGIHQERRAQPY